MYGGPEDGAQIEIPDDSDKLALTDDERLFWVWLVKDGKLKYAGEFWLEELGVEIPKKKNRKRRKKDAGDEGDLPDVPLPA